MEMFENLKALLLFSTLSLLQVNLRWMAIAKELSCFWNRLKASLLDLSGWSSAWCIWAQSLFFFSFACIKVSFALRNIRRGARLLRFFLQINNKWLRLVDTALTQYMESSLLILQNFLLNFFVCLWGIHFLKFWFIRLNFKLIEQLLIIHLF